MPLTRSARRASKDVDAPTPLQAPDTKQNKRGNKRAAKSSDSSTTQTKRARANPLEEAEGTQSANVQRVPAVQQEASTADSGPTFLPAVLTFSFEDAKNHLINADPRFDDVFKKMQCKPYENLERIDPFRTLVTSILGQQISWLAARSITHKFIRLYDSSLPEKPDGTQAIFFPSAHQVVQTDIPTLRTAGLSARKAEYVLDLSARFADGRLSAHKILDASDEELYEMLTAVRGIGRWTVDMFAIFSLRRPDILPVGDLGVQRGVARWFLSLHSPKHTIALSPKKLPAPPTDTAAVEAGVQPADSEAGTSFAANLPSTQDVAERVQTPDASSVMPAPPSTPPRKGSSEDGGGLIPAPPPAFTPSINRTLMKEVPKASIVPLPAGLTIEGLKSRLDGKKKIKGALITPQEMEELTAGWKPYRSLGVYYMWALTEEK